MTKRSRVYFKMIKAKKLVYTIAGRRKLLALGLYPMQVGVSGVWGNGNADVYMLDKKWNIVGSKVAPEPLPDPKPADINNFKSKFSYTITFPKQPHL